MVTINTRHGIVSEEMETPAPTPTLPMIRSSSFDDFFFSDSGSGSNSDSDVELSCPLPLPLPLPLPPSFLTSNIASSLDREVEFSDPLQLPSPALSNATTSIISSHEIDFLEPFVQDRENYFSNLTPPPPPSPLPLNITNPPRRVHRLPPPPAPEPPPPSSHPLPPPPMLITYPNMRIHIPYPLPSPPPPLPTPLSNAWNHFYPEQDPIYPVRFRTTELATSVEEDDDKVELLRDKKMTEELMGSDCSRCAICIDNFEVNEVVREMPCNHLYHSACILPWLETHNTCPLCRYQLPRH